MGSRIRKNFGQNDRINKMGPGFSSPFDVHSVILSKIPISRFRSSLQIFNYWVWMTAWANSHCTASVTACSELYRGW